MEGVILDNICKAYDGKPVLHGLSATLPYGATTSVTAASGEGKTTLLRILMGLERADSGSIRGLDGLRVSAVFQEDRLCENLSAEANIRLVNDKLSHGQALAALAAVGLRDSARQPARALSGGMRRRVAILRALHAVYDILLLDEPFKGLDEETKAAVIAYTKAQCAGRTVLLVTHDASELDAMGATHRLTLAAGKE